MSQAWSAGLKEKRIRKLAFCKKLLKIKQVIRRDTMKVEERQTEIKGGIWWPSLKPLKRHGAPSYVGVTTHEKRRVK